MRRLALTLVAAAGLAAIGPATARQTPRSLRADVGGCRDSGRILGLGTGIGQQRRDLLPALRLAVASRAIRRARGPDNPPVPSRIGAETVKIPGPPPLEATATGPGPCPTASAWMPASRGVCMIRRAYAGSRAITLCHRSSALTRFVRSVRWPRSRRPASRLACELVGPDVRSEVGVLAGLGCRAGAVAARRGGRVQGRAALTPLRRRAAAAILARNRRDRVAALHPHS